MPDSRIGCRLALPVLAVALLALTPSLVRAQAQATTGVIRGRVLDVQGDAVAGAQVTMRNTRTGLERTVGTNDQGAFAATQLPVGTYDVTASSSQVIGEVEEDGVSVRLGETVALELRFRPVEAEAIVAVSRAEVVDPTDVTSSQRFSEEVVDQLPNNGRNFLDFTLLTPGAGIVQGPDGDELSFSGQRGIFNNVIVDGADFNNPFFGEQRGGQRPAFTFNQDAIQEVVVVGQGAPAEFGRSAGGFVNVLTKSGTNELEGSAHYFGQSDALSSDFARGGGNPDFTQHQFGFTLGGPLQRDRAFFFISYDQQEFEQTKQITRLVNDPAEFAKLQAFLQTAFGGTLADDFGPIDRTNDARALFAKLDFNLSESHSAALKYTYSTAEQVNGTFDVDAWGRSSNGIERDHSHAVSGSLHSQLSGTLSNEFRFQWAREDRPREYTGPNVPGQSRPFPDTGIGFADGYRMGLPFFLPIDPAFDTRIQLVDNVSLLRGDHLYKVGVEYNRTTMDQTFVGFGNGRFLFSSVDGFINYVENGPTYVECSDGSSSLVGTCPAGTDIVGPLIFFLQLAPVPPLTSAEEAGTQDLVSHELAIFAQDEWRPTPDVTLNYGLRWEGSWHPDNITPVEDLFYAPFIGQTRNGLEFPSDGEIPDDLNNFQPRFGITWDTRGDGSQVLRANAGLFYARIPQLVFAQHRTTTGSRGQTIFRASFFNGFGLTPPAYTDLLNTAGIPPDHPSIQVADSDLELPRTLSTSAEYERLVAPRLALYLNYQHARTDNLFRFVNRNDAVFGSPWSTGLPAVAGQPTGPNDNLNGILDLTVTESTAHSIYNGITFGLKGSFADWLETEANYTLSWDKSDDDNERDPFVFRYARADALDAEWGYSDRDQRHRFNAYALFKLPGQVFWNNVIRASSAQPVSENCDTGERALAQADRICDDGSVLERNTLRKDNEFLSWDVRLSKVFDVGTGNQFEAIVEVFNLFNTDNFKDPNPASPLFNFDGTLQSGLGDPRRIQLGARFVH